MYVVHGIAHPYHDASTSWIVDCYTTKEKAYKLLDDLTLSLPNKDEYLRRSHRCALTDDEKAALKCIHYRALPNGYINNQFGNRVETLGDNVLGNEYIVEYYVSNTSNINCYATSQLWS